MGREWWGEGLGRGGVGSLLNINFLIQESLNPIIECYYMLLCRLCRFLLIIY